METAIRGRPSRLDGYGSGLGNRTRMASLKDCAQRLVRSLDL
jgi:putative protein kinase ArgK-like GTPase of G3E family